MLCMFTWVCINPAPAPFDVFFQDHGKIILFKLFPYFKAASSSHGRTLPKIKTIFFLCSWFTASHGLVSFVVLFYFRILFYSHLFFSVSKKFCGENKNKLEFPYENKNYFSSFFFFFVRLWFTGFHSKHLGWFHSLYYFIFTYCFTLIYFFLFQKSFVEKTKIN